MKDSHNGGTGFRERPCLGEQFMLMCQIQAGHGLVEKDDGSLGLLIELSENPGPVNPLLFAPGQFGHGSFSQMRNARRRQRCLSPLPRRPAPVSGGFRSQQHHFAGEKWQPAFALLGKKNPFARQLAVRNRADIPPAEENATPRGGKFPG